MGFKFQNQVNYEKTRLYVKSIYAVTGRLPSYEQPGLITHIRKLCSKLLEQNTFVVIKNKSAESETAINASLETLHHLVANLDICHDLGYLDNATYEKAILQSEEVARSLHETKETL